MLQQPKRDDFVIATGEQRSVRQFVATAAAELRMRIQWRGKGVNEVGVMKEPSRRGRKSAERVIVRIDPRYFRPAEVAMLLGDARKARCKLGWHPCTAFRELVTEMVGEDLAIAEHESLSHRKVFRTYRRHE